MKNSERYLELAREIILENIDKKNISVFLFGSRISKIYNSNSDLDIGLFSKREIKKSLINRISDLIEESLIPYHIDFVDFSKVSEEFKNAALKDIVVWNRTKDFQLN